MAAVRRILTNWWVVVIGSALLLSLALFLIAGLLISSLLGWRWWLIGLVWVGVAIAAGWRVWRRKRAQATLSAAIAPPADRESEAVTAKMKAAVGELNKRGKGALYDMPWYVIVGPPGAGKTTIIKKSGLNLVGDADAIKGVGGTRDCDWWFTDEAVLIDTAGRYTSQDSDANRDARTWLGFLATLKKARPLQPLNGVILAIGLDEVATISAEALDRHVVTLRARLAEIGRALGIELPVYVVFTKADLVSGFTEFFEDLSVEGRRSIVGATLPLNARIETGLLANAYDDAIQALADRVPDRLQADGDAVRRGAILTLPARLIDLRSRCVRLVDGVFGVGNAPTNMRLRGFYLTSGVQQGTPFDRLIGDLSNSLGRTTRPQSQTARAFFVNRLFKDVIFAEAGLAGPDAGRRKRDRLTRLAAISIVGLLTVLGLGALAWSFVNNRGGQDATADAAGALAAMVQGTDPGDRVAASARLDDIVPLLDGLAAQLPYGAAGTPPSPSGFGLYRQRLDSESHRAYADALQRYLLPRLILDAETALRNANDEPVASYEPLKVYMMLGNAAGTARDDAYIAQWLEADLNNRTLPGPEAEALRNRLLVHTRALLADSGRFGREINAPLLDAALVERAQAAVAAMGPADRALALLKQQVSGPEWRLVGRALLPGEADAFGNPADLRAAVIPFLFTREGFQAGFIPRAGEIGALLAKDRWMLGGSAAAQAPLDPQALGAAYAAEYTRRWNDVLALPRPANYAAQPVTLARLANPGGSPLKKLTDQIIANTSGLMPVPKSDNKLAQAAIAAATTGLRSGASLTAAGTIEGNFQMLRQYAGGTGAGITGLLTALGDYQKALAQAGAAGGGGGGGGAAAGGGGSAALASAAVALRVASANAGAAAPALASFVDAIASGSSTAAETSRTSELRAAFANGPAATCAAVLGTGFPFGTGADLQPMDVTRAAGAMVAFADSSLQPYLRRTASGWGWVGNEPAVASFSPASARAFERAAAAQALVGGNLVLGIAAGPGTAAPIDLRLSGVPLGLAPGAASQRFNWTYGGLQSAEINAGGANVARADGPWALFRLLGKARRQDLGKGQYRFTFNPATVVDIAVLGGPDPFNPEGVFALRCPGRL